MSAEQFLQYLAQALYVLVFVAVLAGTIRRPLRTNVNVTLLFGATTIAIVLGLFQPFLTFIPSSILTGVSTTLIMALPYLFLRLVDDFAGLPRLVMRGAEVGLVLATLAAFLAPLPYPLWIVGLDVLYFVALEVYGSIVVVTTARQSSGLTSRRMTAVALGSALLGLAILAAGFQAAIPASSPLAPAFVNLCALGSGVGYFFGFATPTWLRRAWQESELWSFVAKSTRVSGFDDGDDAIRAFEESIAQSLGATGAWIGLLDPGQSSARLLLHGGAVSVPIENTLIGHAIAEQQAVLTTNVERDAPALAERLPDLGSSAVVIAPLGSAKKPLGVVVAYASRVPLFADSDLAFARLLANHVAVIVENRILAIEGARTRARAESLAAVEAERRQLFGMLEQAPAIVCHYRGPEHVVAFANQAYVRLMPGDSILGKSARDTRSAFHNEDSFAVLDRVFATGEAVVATEQRLAIEGSVSGAVTEAYFSSFYQPTHDLDGRVDGVLLYGFDVTDEVTARHAVERAADRISRLQGITASLSERRSPREVARVIVDEVVAALNATGAAVVRLAADNQNLDVLWTSEYASAPPSLGPALERWRSFPLDRPTPFRDAIRDRVPVFLESREERASRYPETVPEQDAFNLNASASLPLLEGERAIGVLYLNFGQSRRFLPEERSFLLAVAHHCAQALERARLDEAERTARVATEVANRELEAFSYSVAHDLRAPLRAMDGFSRILLEEYAAELSPEGQHYAQLIQANAQQMGRLIDDLLEFSRLGRKPVRKQSVDLAELVRQVLVEVEPESRGRPIEVNVGSLPSVVADPALLKQMFANLLANAFKFTRRREGARIEVGCGEDGGETVYWVRDNGVGFDMRYVDKLFHVFQRLHREEEYEGTGVGLAIVQRVIHRHGGRIWAEAEIDRGATFYFTLDGGTSDG